MVERLLTPFITALALSVFAGPAQALTDLWDLPPIRYSDSEASDPLASWFESMDSQSTVGMSGLERLEIVLEKLSIPQESQVLVFSKTSKQNNLIHPRTPRAIYFSENAYVSYVPGGDIEAIVHDPSLGAIFYLISAGERDHPMRLKRDTSSCMSCHGTARTEHAPGVLVRSVFPDDTGLPILTLGSFTIDDRTPIPQRWGGYYMTEQSPLPHLGNRTFVPGSERSLPAQPVSLTSLRGKITTENYLAATSDIVALMVLEHQCRIHNLIASASLQHQRSTWLRLAFDPDSPPSPQQIRTTRDAARKIVDALLFVDEADMKDGVEGSATFQEAFSKRFPKTKAGKSLADFRLQGRIFKNRCSYMVYSSSFSSAPQAIRDEIVRQLRDVLGSPSGSDEYSHIKTSERKRIATILEETWPSWSSIATEG